MNFTEYLISRTHSIENLLAQYLPNSPDIPEILAAAICYSVTQGGKRFRPLLVYATGESFAVAQHYFDAVAVSIELIHAYSLIHDDLPAMDNAALRRGQPSCHKIFGVANAILAGDALQPLAFSIIANDPHISAQQKLACIKCLSQASGAAGMVGGQVLDMAAEKKVISLDELYKIHALKTGALIKACVVMAAIIAEVNQNNFDNLQNFAEKLGLAYQLQDDILDVAATTVQLGKTQGQDQCLQKASFVQQLGLTAAKELLQKLTDEIDNHLLAIEFSNNWLQPLTKLILKRIN